MKFIILLITILIFPLIVGAQAIVSTFAGGSNVGVAGDSGQAVNAGIHNPQKGHFDKQGNYYVVHKVDHRIRKIGPDGIIRTVAGVGLDAYSGDGWLATVASLNYPEDVVTDNAGNLYIADSRNNRVRKVDVTTGFISTIAGNQLEADTGDGGPAINASLKVPVALAFDNDGNLHIGCVACVRKIDHQTGIITTVAGRHDNDGSIFGEGGPATDASLNGIQFICFNPGGDLHVGQYTCIRKVDKNTGIITTIAGNPNDGTYNGDWIPATQAQFNCRDAEFDQFGNLLVNDWINERIRLINPLGIIKTIAGCGFSGYAGDGGDPLLARFCGIVGSCFDTCGNVYIADACNGRIRKVTYPYCHALDVNTPSQTSPACTVYPNPAAGHITVSADREINTVDIYDVTGNLVTHYLVRTETTTLDISLLSSGIYFVNIECNGLMQIKKLLIL